jgi:hypothetical protein
LPEFENYLTVLGKRWLKESEADALCGYPAATLLSMPLGTHQLIKALAFLITSSPDIA